MDEKYLQELYNRLGGQSKFGVYNDFKELMTTNEAYRKHFHSTIGEQTLGSYSDFEGLVKKKDGINTLPTSSNGVSPTKLQSPEDNTPTEPIPEFTEGQLGIDPISQAKKYKELSNATISEQQPSSEGIMNVPIPDENARYEAKQIKKDIEARGFKVDELNNVFGDFPEQAHDLTLPDGTKPLSKDNLLQLYKDNPIDAQSKINNVKTQFQLQDAGKKKALENDNSKDEHAAQQYGIELGNYFNSLHGAVHSMPELYNNIAEQQRIINENLIGEERQKALQRVQESNAKFINPSVPQLQDEYNQTPLKSVIDPNQYAGLKTLELFNPQGYQQATKMLTASPEKQFEPTASYNPVTGDYSTDNVETDQSIDTRKGLEIIKKKLSDIGRNNTLTDAQSKLNNSKVNYPKTDDLKQRDQIATEYEKNKNIIDATKADFSKDDQRYPLLAADKFGMQVQEMTQKANMNPAENFVYHLGKGFDNTGSTINNVLTSLFGSDKSNTELQMQRLGEGESDKTYEYLPTTMQSEQPNVLYKFSDGLKTDVNNVLKDKNISDNDKRQQVAKIMADRQNEVSTITNPDAGKEANFFSKATLQRMTGMLGDVSSLALQAGGLGALGVGASLSSAIPMYLTSQNDYYKQAVAEGNPDPSGYANTHATIMFLAGTIAPQLSVVKRALGTNTALGKAIDGITEETWDNVISKNKPLLQKFQNSITSAGKEAAMIGGVYGGATTAANELTDKLLYNKDISTEDIISHAVKATKNSVLDFLPVIGLNAITHFKGTSPEQKALIWESGTTPDIAMAQIDEDIKSGKITPAQGDQRKESVQTISNLIKKVPTENTKGKPLTDEQRTDYLYNLLIREKSSKLKSDLPEKHQDKAIGIIAQADEENSHILDGTKPKLIETTPDAEHTFKYDSDKDIPKVLSGVKPISKKEVETTKGSKFLEVKYSGQQLIDAGLAKDSRPPITEPEAPKVKGEEPEISKPIELDAAQKTFVEPDEISKPIELNVEPNATEAQTTELPNTQEASSITNQEPISPIEETGEGKGSGSIYEEIYKPILEGTDIPKREQALKEIAEQWHDPNSRNQLEKSGIPEEIINEAKEKYPPTNGKEQTPPPPTEPPIPPIEEGGKYEKKAKILAEKIKSAELPQWLINTDPILNKSGVSGDAIKKALSDAVINMGKLLDKGVEFSKAVKEAVKDLVNLMGEDKRNEIESGFAQHYKDEGGIREIGTKKALNDALREEMGLRPLELPKHLTKDEGVVKGKELVDNGEENPLDIINNVLANQNDPNSIKISPNNEFAMIYYERQLDAERTTLNDAKINLEEKINAEPDNEEAKGDLATVTQKLLNNYDAEERRLNASQIMGNVGSKYFNARQISVDERGLVVNAINRIKTIYGDNMSPDVKAKLSELQQKYDDLTARNQKIENEAKDLQAENELLKKQLEAKKGRGLFGTKRAKKTDAEFEKERLDILEKLKADLLKVAKGGGGLSATIPGVPQLKAIAPHIAAFVKNFAEQGLNKLDDVVVKIHDIIKDTVEGITKEDIRDIISGQYNDTKTRTQLAKDISDLKSQAILQKKIENYEKGIVEATKKKGEQSDEVKALQQKLSDLKSQANNKYANLSSAEIEKQIEAAKNKIRKGEFLKTPFVKRTFEKNEKWIKNNQELTNVKKQLRDLEYQAMQSKKSMYMRGLDWINRWGRRVIFFGANAVYTKLSSAAVLGSFVHRPFEQALGKLNKSLFPHIAANAPIEGFINMAAEIKFYKEFLNPKKLGKDVWQIGKTGQDALSKELSRHTNLHHIPIVDLFAADTHMMIKSPVKRATFEAAMINTMKFYAENGIDATHPLLLESARQSAYKTAEYEIFQNSAKNSKGVSAFFNELEKSGVLNNSKPDVWSKIKGNAQYTVASLYHFFIPVNTVPLNIMKRIGLGLRTPITMVEAMAKNKAIKEGILNLTHDEANLLMAQLKKGQIGTAYWTLGFIVAGSVVGGTYTKYYPDKQRKGMKADEMNIGGIEIPKNVQHNYQLQSMQMGATWGMVYNHYIDDKGATQLEAMMYATGATIGAMAEGLPTIKEGEKMAEAIQSPGGMKSFGKDLKRRVGVGKAFSLFNLMGYGDSNGNEGSGKMITHNGEQIELTNDQSKELDDIMTKTKEQYQNNLEGTSEYRDADKEEKIKLEQKYSKMATEKAHEQLKAKYPDQFQQEDKSEKKIKRNANKVLNLEVTQ